MTVLGNRGVHLPENWGAPSNADGKYYNCDLKFKNIQYGKKIESKALLNLDHWTGQWFITITAQAKQFKCDLIDSEPFLQISCPPFEIFNNQEVYFLFTGRMNGDIYTLDQSIKGDIYCAYNN